MNNSFLWMPVLGVIVYCFSFLGFVTSAGAVDEKTVVEEILQILREKGAISADKYEKLRVMVEEEKAKDAKKSQITFKKGFTIKTADKAFKLKIGGRLHNDLRVFQSGHPKNSEFIVRRARIYASGTLYKYYDFKVESEFGMNKSALNDGYLNVKYFPHLQFKIGQYKVPFSLEELTSDNYIDFVERPLPVDNLVPSRDRGIMMHGGLAEGVVHYGIGIFNGTRKNTSDSDNHKDVAARLVLSPFNKSENFLLKGLHLGCSVTSGKEDMDMQGDKNRWWSKGKFQTAGDTKFFEFNDAVVHDGRRDRYGVELAWMLGPLSLKGEWMRMDLNDLECGSQKSDFHIDGGYFSLSYFLTGEHQPFKKGVYKGITPLHNFDPRQGKGFGAIQLVARYELLDIDDHLLERGYADAAQFTDQAEGFTLGVNWWLNEMVRIMINYNRVEFDDYVAKADGDNEDVGLVRFQLVY